MVKRLNGDLLLFFKTKKVMYINIYCTGFCSGEKKRKINQHTLEVCVASVR